LRSALPNAPLLHGVVSALDVADDRVGHASEISEPSAVNRLDLSRVSALAHTHSTFRRASFL
jgi:hypothetical protein